MNYRAFNLATGLPLATSVPEPESAGSIAWLLYNTYLETGNRDYFLGAQLALDFLANWSENPSYELQLPYGTLAAARMNAVEGLIIRYKNFSTGALIEVICVDGVLSSGIGAGMMFPAHW